MTLKLGVISSFVDKVVSCSVMAWESPCSHSIVMAGMINKLQLLCPQCGCSFRILLNNSLQETTATWSALAVEIKTVFLPYCIWILLLHISSGHFKVLNNLSPPDLCLTSHYNLQQISNFLSSFTTEACAQLFTWLHQLADDYDMMVS